MFVDVFSKIYCHSLKIRYCLLKKKEGGSPKPVPSLLIQRDEQGAKWCPRSRTYKKKIIVIKFSGHFYAPSRSPTLVGV